MKIKDRMLDVILLKTDVPNLIRSWFPDYIDDNNVICPFHDDLNASLHISPDGSAHCHGCGWSAKSIIELFAKMEDYKYVDARRVLYEDVVKAVSPQRVAAYMKNLWSSDGKSALHYLVFKRGLHDKTTIVNCKLGLDPRTQRITIPVYDQFGTCVNIRMASWNRKSDNKMVNMRGHGEVRVYPEDKIVKSKKLLLVEGEWDCLVARQHGIDACTWTGGAHNFNPDHYWLFRNKTVFLLYDNDSAGEKGKWLMIDQLRYVVSALKTVDPLSNEGKDVTDWALADPECMERLRIFIDMFKVNGGRRKKVCPTCKQEIR